jgi:hypothetical protein
VSAAALALVFAALPGLATAACPNEAIRSVTSTNLPNCRAYEKVSPEDKDGNYAVRLGFPTRATGDGNGLSFLELGPYANPPSGHFNNAYVARRGPSGWTVTNVSPPATPDPLAPGGAFASYHYSSDLSQHVAKVAKQAVTPEADRFSENLFHRSTSGSYSLVNTNPPPVKLPEECPGPFLQQGCFQLVNLVTFAGSTPDFRHLLIQTRKNFFDFEDREQLYRADLVNGRWEMSPVGILPNGEPTREGSAPGSGMFITASNFAKNFYNRVANAISADGSRVFFQAQSNEGEPNESGQLGLTQVGLHRVRAWRGQSHPCRIPV